MNFASPKWTLAAALTGTILAGLTAASSSGWAAARKKPIRAGAATSRQTQHIGAFNFESDEVAWEGITGGARLILSGDVVLTGPGRTITAQEVSIDVPKGASDISIARAAGNVKMALAQKNGQMTAEGKTLLYNKGAGTVDVGGGVHIHSDLVEGGSVDATGQTAQVLTGPNTATLTGGVQLTLVKPDTIQGPAHFTGEKMAVDLSTGNWKLSGGRTRGNFDLLPPKPKPAGNP